MRFQTRTLAFALLLSPLLQVPAEALDSVVLGNGNKLTGEIVERSDEYLVLDHPQLGRLTIQMEDTKTPSNISGATQVIAETPVPIPIEQTSESDDGNETPSTRGLFGTRILRGWDNRFSAGLSGSQGGFDDTKLSVSFRTENENPSRHWDFEGTYFLNLAPSSEGEDPKVTKDQGFGQLRRKWLFPDSERWSRAFAVARTRYDFNDFQPWVHRIAASGGPGYFLFQNDKFQLPINAGFGFASVFGEASDTDPEATLGFDLRWNFAAWGQLTSSNQFFYDLSSSGHFRTTQSAAFQIDPGSQGGVGFSFGILYQHDTRSTGRQNDVTYLSSLTYGF